VADLVDRIVAVTHLELGAGHRSQQSCGDVDAGPPHPPLRWIDRIAGVTDPDSGLSTTMFRCPATVSASSICSREPRGAPWCRSATMAGDGAVGRVGTRCRTTRLPRPSSTDCTVLTDRLPMPSPHVTWNPGSVTRAERIGLSAAGGATIWCTGLSGSGKSTLAAAVEGELVHRGRAAYRLDGDNLRTGLNGDLDFGRASREENVRRVAEVACLFADAGMVALVALISPYAASRRAAREIHERAGLPFLEVYLATPLELCEQRDAKGLYAAARAGRIRSFTGVDDPYDVPEHAEVVVPPSTGVADAVEWVLTALDDRVATLAERKCIR